MTERASQGCDHVSRDMLEIDKPSIHPQPAIYGHPRMPLIMLTVERDGTDEEPSSEA